MGNRTGVYVAFHAGGTTDPTASDIKYYNMMKGWDAHNKRDFSFVNSHEKTSSVRDTSSRETLRQRLRDRLNVSKSIVLIATTTTRNDTDNVPFELTHGIEKCGLPVIVTYPGFSAPLQKPPFDLLPDVLRAHIKAGTVKTIHVPFREKSLLYAIDTYSVHSPPSHAYGVLPEDTYRTLGELTR